MKINSTRIAAILVTLTALALITIGCSKEQNEAKKQLLEALAKQQQITSHTYGGNLSLNLGKLPIDAASQPYTSIILSALSQGDIQWNGTTDTAQNRREATLEFQASDGSSAFVIPVIQDDNALYVHVPLINTEDEYFVLPKPGLTDELGRLMLSTLTRIIEQMDAKWFELEANDSANRTYQIKIDESRWGDFLNHLRQALPNVLNEWQQAGVINASQANAIQNSLTPDESGGEPIRLTEGQDVYIRAIVQDHGYLSALDFSLSLDTKSSSGTTETYQLEFSHTWDHINEQVTFTRGIPETTVAWEEILKLIP
jgi:hypothetical protein